MKIGSEQNIIVFRGWGKDEPGIAQAFMKAVRLHNCQVLDLGQFVMDGSLMFTFVVDSGGQNSMGFLKDVSKVAKELQLQLHFYFPDAENFDGDRTADKIAVLSVVSAQDFTPALLHAIDSVLSENGCVVRDIEHREDNKRENIGEYNKIEFRISCPPRLKLSALRVGVPKAEGEMTKGLQDAAWDHGAEITLRWWNALNLPNGKSLVVFGISNLLVTCNVLDEILIEAGLDPNAVPAQETIEKDCEKKVALLKGKRADVVQKVLDRLEFTPGARLVCAAMKRLGFRLAILTNTSCRKAAEFIKRELDMDYVITRDSEVDENGCFTGNYTGELTEVRFRKADLVTLMAEREGIEYRNVILVGGEIVTNLTNRSIRDVMETFGPVVYFDTDKMKDLTIVLYLLGFNGSDVHSLRQKFKDCNGNYDPDEKRRPRTGKRFKVQVNAQTRSPGQIQRILAPLKVLEKQPQIANVSLCSLKDGGMCIGLDLCVQDDEPDSLLKELLFVCQTEGFQVMGSGFGSDAAPPPAELSFPLPRYVITLVQKPLITAESLSSFFEALHIRSVNMAKIERLSIHDLTALQLTVILPSDIEIETFSNDLIESSKSCGLDIAFQKDDLDRWMRRLVVFDMDSTLIQQEVIDELAAMAGVETQVKEITEAAMRGEINFFDSLKSRVALLEGHNAEELFSKVRANLVYTHGAKKLCSTLRQLGFRMAVISGGFLPLAREVQRYLGLDYAFANSLEVDEATGLLTGNTIGAVVTPQRKRALLATIANVEGCEMQQTIAVGDGANDIPMLNAAGLGIAFCAKPKVQAATEIRINQMDLSTVLFLIGVSEHAADRLGVEGSDRSEDGQTALGSPINCSVEVTH